MGEKTRYFVPRETGFFELVEKKSRFLAQVWQVSSEEEAQAHLEATRKKYHDARHHCWCYRLGESALRYSDDGEPQGTAGQPMLNLLIQENIQQVCCVVTRYFGGTLLGTGGLVRAYTHSVKGALEQAGLSTLEELAQIEIICPYPLFELVQKVILEEGGLISQSNYGVDVEILAEIAVEKQENLMASLTEKTAAQVLAEVVGQLFRFVPWEPSP